MVLVAGVDGCPGGWAVVTATVDGGSLGSLGAEFTEDLAPLVDRVRAAELAALAVDMPIGLLDDRPRACDREARRMLGPRRSSVFPAPVRAVLAAADYEECCRLSRKASGRAISKQTFNLLPKIRELDRIVRPEDQDQIVEAHPECAFARMGGASLDEPKRTPEGRAARRRLLDGALGARAVDELLATNAAPELDVIDAAALVTTAARIVAGTAVRLGGEVDATGKRCEIVF